MKVVGGVLVFVGKVYFDVDDEGEVEVDVEVIVEGNYGVGVRMVGEFRFLM